MELKKNGKIGVR